MPSRMKRPFTLSDIERLRDMAARGRTITQAADALNRSWESVRNAALRHAIEFRAQSKDDA